MEMLKNSHSVMPDSWSAMLVLEIILCNPVCLIGYTIVSWRFFNESMYEEEIALLNFFGEDYSDYQRRVGTGIPFIKGFDGSGHKI
ncbi:hypothetical protein DPMN_119546 [Dreissena polymorpha]|uniref:Protein-S-isoprenylcysteine O-methyltransferase n=1 Tax=Dreissena polymorpha TaxID=45954 RepID=A0A9D4GM65_DREPO|nr:hypothetical protein DPMN_119546 [Dreissena polymorpha]